MNDFNHLRQSGRHSWLIGAGVRIGDVIAAAWRSSTVAAIVNGTLDEFQRLAPVDRIRWIATTIAVAALAHLGLRSLLARTVVPALPSLLAGGVAVLAAVVAWQAGAFERAWRAR